MSTTASNPVDWPAFYSGRALAAWGIPAASQDDPDNGIFRRLFVKWSDLPKKDQQGEAPPMWFLCADVLDLDADIVLDRPAFVFARRIEVSNGAGLILDRTEASPDLLLFAQEVVAQPTGQPAKLSMTALSAAPGKDPVETDYAFAPDPAAGATGLAWPARAPQPAASLPAGLDPAHLLEGEPLRLALMTAFQLATLLSTEQAALSQTQLRWVASLAQANPDTRDLALQARALADLLLAQQTADANALLVPRLDPSVYAETSGAFMDLLKQRQDAWDRLQRMKADDTNWAAAAQESLGQQQNQQNLAVKLEQQAQASRQQALTARDIAARQVILDKAKTSECELAFELGIKRWKEKETEKAAIALVTGIFDILKEIPTIVAAGPEFAVLPAVQTGMSLVSGAADFLMNRPAPAAPAPVQGPKTKAETEADEKAAKNAAEEQGARKATQDKLVGGLKAAGAGAKEIYDAATRINQVAAIAQGMETSSREVLSQIGGTTGAALTAYSVQGLDVVTGGSQDWDTLSVAVEDTFENIGGGILKDIDGGTDYRLSFRRLIISGKALSQARLAVARANSELAELTLRRLAAEKAVVIAKQRAQQLAGQVQRDQTLAQLAFNRVLDAKRSVYLALEAFRRAFLYFTLAPDNQAVTLPRLTDSVDRFGTAVAQVSGRRLTDEALTRAPQSMPDISFLLNDPAVLASLQKDGVATWQLAPADPKFADYGRIRLAGVQAFAQGVTSGGPIEVQIATSGSYLDKLTAGGVSQEFVGQPMRLNFLYAQPSAAGDPKVLVKADIAPRYVGDFFNPTPFTSWTFLVKSQDGRPLDLTAITGLAVQFTGEVTSIS